MPVYLTPDFDLCQQRKVEVVVALKQLSLWDSLCRRRKKKFPRAEKEDFEHTIHNDLKAAAGLTARLSAADRSVFSDVYLNRMVLTQIRSNPTSSEPPVPPILQTSLSDTILLSRLSPAKPDANPLLSFRCSLAKWIAEDSSRGRLSFGLTYQAGSQSPSERILCRRRWC